MTALTTTGTATLARAGKRDVAQSMYSKGVGFLGAALLIRRHGGNEYVILHLLCQAIEIILKSLLLALDYDRFKPKLKAQFGHHLDRIADAACSAFNLSPLRPELRAELKGLSNLYAQHYLRYGSGLDILIDPRSLESRRVLRRMYAVLRLLRRKGLMNEPVI